MKPIFGGLVAIILLGLYVYAIVIAILAVQCLSQPNCQEYTKDLNEGIVFVLNLVGGLVSALVVAELAVTPPGKPPVALKLAANATPTTKNLAMWVSIAFIIVWLVCGVVALIVGYLQYPNVVPALTASAKSWLGIAVAAAYSYLGIK
jgi:hypothetical protein